MISRVIHNQFKYVSNKFNAVFSAISHSTLLNKIKDVAKINFHKVKMYSTQPKQANIKPIAMIGCLVLITLLFIAIFRREDRTFLSRSSYRGSTHMPKN